MHELEEYEPDSSKGWSIHSRCDITAKYEILEHIGSGASYEVYRAKRRSDSGIVALKEVHHERMAFQEIEALQILESTSHVINLHEYFYNDDYEERPVLVLDYLPCDVASVIEDIKYGGGDYRQVKSFMWQMLSGVDLCHRRGIVHRDLKLSNVLVSDSGDIIKIADFGKAGILDARGSIGEDPYDSHLDQKRQWIKAPELLLGSKNYGVETDLWSLGCLFAELLTLEPIFAAETEIDQLLKVFSVHGNLTEDVWSGCVDLPLYHSFECPRVEKPIGLEAVLSNSSLDEICIVKSLLRLDPAKRSTASELLLDEYFSSQ